MADDLRPMLTRSQARSMRVVTPRSGSAGETPKATRAAGRSVRPGRMAGRGGGILALGGLAIAAGLTIAAFFGVGLVLSTGHPADPIRSASLGAGTRAAPAVSRSAAAERAAPDMPDHFPAPQGADAAPVSARAALASGASPGEAPPVGPPPKTAAAAAERLPALASASDKPGPSSERDAARAAPVDAAPQSGAQTKPQGAVEAQAKPDPAVPQASSRSPTTSPLSSAEITTLLVQGDDAFRAGDLTSARLYYLRAFGAGDGRGALGIGASYDPEFLRRFRLWTQHSDPAEARTWYLRARQLGAAGADSRLAKLNEKTLR